MELAIETHALTRAFGTTIAVNAIDLAVPRGSFYGFLGPNAAGNSTTTKGLTGLLRPTSGSIRILGLDLATSELEIKRHLGVIPEEQALFERLTAKETLAFVGQVHGIDKKTLVTRIDELLQLLDLTNASGKLVADYSHGMRKKLALAVALLPAPKILFLDEPFEGIDAVASREIKELLHGFVTRGGTVFLTSHIIEIVERLADHVGIIHQGRLITQGSLSELKQRYWAGATLEEIFISQVGGVDDTNAVLEWLA